jgi:hypothetical protein
MSSAEEVVGWLGAVQAQDFAGAKWALGLRMKEATDSSVEKAFNDGAILRTHILRPTWHFVTPADIRWIQALTAPRVNVVNAHMYRQLELDEKLFASSNALITKVLSGGQQLTREELGAALAAGGIEASGMRLGYIVHRAELDAVVCSGPRRGKQFTYMLVDERAPGGRVLAKDEALAELTFRYFAGHGPATVRDFAWWSGLTMAEVKRGIEIVGSGLDSERIHGAEYWYPPSTVPMREDRDAAFLLPTYDEFFMGFTGESRAAGLDAKVLIFDSMVVLDGQIAGTWRRTIKGGAVDLEVKMLPPYAEGDGRVAAAGERFGAFVGMPAEVRHVTVSELKGTGWMYSRLSNQKKGEQDSKIDEE